jgi:NADPH:quinone reductase
MARRTGAYADYTLVSQIAPGEAFARIPDGVSFEQAAVLLVAGVTALGGLALLDVMADQRLLVLGAAGGIGGFALPFARTTGAHVVATTRGGEAEALRFGAQSR